MFSLNNFLINPVGGRIVLINCFFWMTILCFVPSVFAWMVTGAGAGSKTIGAVSVLATAQVSSASKLNSSPLKAPALVKNTVSFSVFPENTQFKAYQQALSASTPAEGIDMNNWVNPGKGALGIPTVSLLDAQGVARYALSDELWFVGEGQVIAPSAGISDGKGNHELERFMVKASNVYDSSNSLNILDKSSSKVVFPQYSSKNPGKFLAANEADVYVFSNQSGLQLMTTYDKLSPVSGLSQVSIGKDIDTQDAGSAYANKSCVYARIYSPDGKQSGIVTLDKLNSEKVSDMDVLVADNGGNKWYVDVSDPDYTSELNSFFDLAFK